MIQDGHWRCSKGHEWRRSPEMTKCPTCGAIDGIELDSIWKGCDPLACKVLAAPEGWEWKGLSYEC